MIFIFKFWKHVTFWVSILEFSNKKSGKTRYEINKSQKTLSFRGLIFIGNLYKHNSTTT
jgi:hypothetical protein